MVKALPSSGTLLNDGVLALCGLRMLSTELFREVRLGLIGRSDGSVASFRRCFMRSISCWPLSSVKDRKASNRFLDLNKPCMKIRLPGSCELPHHTSKGLRLTVVLILYNSIYRVK